MINVNVALFCFTICIIALGIILYLSLDKIIKNTKNECRTLQIVINSDKDLQKLLKKLEQDFKEFEEE